MRAFVIDQRTNFMRYLDVFNDSKVIYSDLDLQYQVNGKTVIDDESILYLARQEFKNNLIVLLAEDKPLFINKNIQVISTGKQWIRLIDVLRQLYPNLNFNHDNKFKNISIKN